PFTLDEKNRLILTRQAAEKIALGPLKIGSNVRVSEYPDGEEFPERVALDGKWKLNEKHDLEFGISASSVWFPGMTILFKTGVVNASSEKIVFSARLTDPGAGDISSALAFSGRWRADKNNRLNFDITRYAGKTDRLVFQGAWEIGANNELFYKYSASRLKTKEKMDFSFGLKGKWEIGEGCQALSAKRIAYRIEGSSDSVLLFSAALETPSIRAKAGEIRYSVGVRFTSGGKEREILRSAAVFGSWKLGRDLKLAFDAETTAKGRNVITFTAEKPVLKNGKLIAGLKFPGTYKPAAQIEFAKPLARDVELFFGGSIGQDGYRAVGGVRGKF
ncbi:MAG: hypothetical protein PHW14_04800, partial [Candidatus Omnitrophica bacterium]|nr:hypothetical protein [Candidatus Omnitrophota bacterium]